MRKSLDAGQVDEDDEGGSPGGSIVAVCEARSVPRHAEADNEEGGEVDDSDTPESSLDGSRKGLAGVGSFGGSKSDELGSSCERDERSAVNLRPVWRSSPKEKAAVTKTVQTPLNPLAKAPGFRKYSPPM